MNEGRWRRLLATLDHDFDTLTGIPSGGSCTCRVRVKNIESISLPDKYMVDVKVPTAAAFEGS